MRYAGRLRRRGLRVDLNEDPFALLVNFFDCSLVFALGFIIALLARDPSAVASALEHDGAQQRAAAPELESVAGERRPEHLKATSDTASGEGVRLGTAYRLANGDIVYVPDPSKPH